MTLGSVHVQVLRILGRHLDWRLPGCGSRLRDRLASALLKIRDKHGRLVRLLPNRAQAEFARRASGRDLVLKARQLGVTTWVAARFFIATITRPGTLTVQVAHDQQSAEEIFRIVRRFFENLPPRLRCGALVTSRDNVRQLVFPRLDSEYRVETAADPNAGRGLTIHNLHCSEVARWPRDAAATLASLRAAVPPEGEIVLESTPNGAAGCFYDEWQHAASAGYTRHFFPWWYEKDYTVDGRRSAVDGKSSGPGGAPNSPAADGHRPSTLDDSTGEERELIAKHKLSLAQIAFRRRLRANFGKLARQEFAEDPVSCFLASGECVFEIDVIERRLAQCSAEVVEVARPSSAGMVEAPGFSGGNAAAEKKGAFAPVVRPIESRDNGRLLIWWPPKPGAEYVVGVDPAGGGCDGDYSCAQLIERVTGLQCAELHGHIPPQPLATQIAALGREYNQALIAVERNNHGHGVIAYLAAYEHYPRLYEQHRQVGWLTSAVSRPRMVEQLAALLARQPELFSSPRLLSECRTFVRQSDGAAAAASGAHDDCVMAMAIAQAVRLEQAGGHRTASEVELASFAR